MHDPHTVAFEIFLGRKIKKNGHYRAPIITIWHKDPEKDGTDDSCGWFQRARHGSKEIQKEIRSRLAFDLSRSWNNDDSTTPRIYQLGLFTENGDPNMSVMGITLCMFHSAAFVYFNRDRKKMNKWLRDNLHDILHFAENPTDSLWNEITGVFRKACNEPWMREEALDHYTSAIYGYLLRSTRKWYQHPRWHIHHWQIQFHPWQNLKRRYWDKCSKCGKMGLHHNKTTRNTIRIALFKKF